MILRNKEKEFVFILIRPLTNKDGYTSKKTITNVDNDMKQKNSHTPAFQWSDMAHVMCTSQHFQGS